MQNPEYWVASRNCVLLGWLGNLPTVNKGVGQLPSAILFALVAMLRKGTIRVQHQSNLNSEKLYPLCVAPNNSLIEKYLFGKRKMQEIAPLSYKQKGSRIERKKGPKRTRLRWKVAGMK